jgi:hypothetical protein
MHRLRHSTIGLMADLNLANISDVRKWFRDNSALTIPSASRVT